MNYADPLVKVTNTDLETECATHLSNAKAKNKKISISR